MHHWPCLQCWCSRPWGCPPLLWSGTLLGRWSSPGLVLQKDPEEPWRRSKNSFSPPCCSWKSKINSPTYYLAQLQKMSVAFSLELMYCLLASFVIIAVPEVKKEFILPWGTWAAILFSPNIHQRSVLCSSYKKEAKHLFYFPRTGGALRALLIGLNWYTYTTWVARNDFLSPNHTHTSAKSNPFLYTSPKISAQV